MWTYTINRIATFLIFFPWMLWGGTYPVGIGDQVGITVFGEAEFTGTFRISSDGTIDYPFIRKIPVVGKTAEEISKIIAEKLQNGYLKDPQVQVEVKEFNSQKVMILGAINKPGTYTLTEETRILDILSKAGGISLAGGKRIILLREEKESSLPPVEKTIPENQKKEEQISTSATPIMIDYYALINQGDLTQNHVLKNGDIVNIPKANEIFVLGNVSRPGPIKFEDNMTILQAVTLAGGPTPTASTKSTYIIRQGEKGESKVRVRLDKILDNKEKNVALKPDDVIVIPESFF